MISRENPINGAKKVVIYHNNSLDSLYAAGWVYRYAKKFINEIECYNTHLENCYVPKNPVDDTCAVFCGCIPHMQLFDQAMKMYHRNVVVFENRPTFIKYLKMYNWDPCGLIFQNATISKLALLFLQNKYRMAQSDPWHCLDIPDPTEGLVCVDYRNYPNFDSKILNTIEKDNTYLETMEDWLKNPVDPGIMSTIVLSYLDKYIRPFEIYWPNDVGYRDTTEEYFDEHCLVEAKIIASTKWHMLGDMVDSDQAFPVRLRKFEKYDAIAINSNIDNPEVFKHRTLYDKYHIGIIFHMEYTQMYYSVYRLKKDKDVYINIEKICTSFGGWGNANHGEFIVSSGMLEISPTENHP